MKPFFRLLALFKSAHFGSLFVGAALEGSDGILPQYYHCTCQPACNLQRFGNVRLGSHNLSCRNAPAVVVTVHAGFP